MDTQTQFCSFQLADLCFGFDVQRVQEVIRSPLLAPVPLAPPAISGLLNLRGQILTAIDLRRQLCLPEEEDSSEGRMLMIVCCEEGQVAFLVDSVGDVIDVDESSFESPPENLPASVRPFLRGVHKLDSSLLHVLDIEATASALNHEISL